MKLIPLKQQQRFNGKMPYEIAKVLKNNELRLYIMLLEHHNNIYNYAFPTYEDIRSYFDRSWDNKNIRKYLKGLEEKGFIVIGKHSKKVGYDNNTYTLFAPDFTEENKKINELRVIEYEIDKIDNAIKMYENSLEKNLRNEDIRNYLIFEIEELQTTKKDLLSHQQTLLD